MKTVTDSGVDWLTLTFDQYHENRKDFLSKREALMQEVAGTQGGIESENWQGYAGRRCFGLFIGERPDGDIIRASGSDAKIVERWCREHNWKATCTRIDLQLTAKIDRMPQAIAKRIAGQAQRSASRGHGGRGGKVALYQTGADSTGVTIGGRSSERYCRFYDKTTEQRNRIEKNLWRFEVEFKGQQARLMFQMMISAVSSYELALSIVSTTFEMHGIPMKWVKKSEKLSLPSTYRRNDDQRRLEWLFSHVRGTVQKLIAKGFEKDVYLSLGLDLPDRLL